MYTQYTYNAYTSGIRSRAVSIKFSLELLKKIDADARANFTSRSNYIRETLALRLNNQHIVTEQTEDDYLKNLADRFS